jgi:hypothetical protein
VLALNGNTFLFRSGDTEPELRESLREIDGLIEEANQVESTAPRWRLGNLTRP